MTEASNPTPRQAPPMAAEDGFESALHGMGAVHAAPSVSLVDSLEVANVSGDQHGQVGNQSYLGVRPRCAPGEAEGHRNDFDGTLLAEIDGTSSVLRKAEDNGASSVRREAENDRKSSVLRAWAVGITTAPRAEETLSRTLESFTNTALPMPQFFADYGATVPEGYAVTRRDAQVGAWPNFFLALSELVMRQPEADYYLMLQPTSSCAAMWGGISKRCWTNPAAHSKRHRSRHAPRGEEPHAERED